MQSQLVERQNGEGGMRAVSPGGTGGEDKENKFWTGRWLRRSMKRGRDIELSRADIMSWYKGCDGDGVSMGITYEKRVIARGGVTVTILTM